MITGQTNNLPARMERVRKRFERWRRTRKPRARIPDSLWAAAVEMAVLYGLHRTARAIPVEYYSLKKRLEQRSAAVGRASPEREPAFVELSPLPPGGCDCMLELEDMAGSKMRIQLKAATLAVMFAGGMMLLNPLKTAVQFLLKQPTLSMRRLGIVAAAGVGCIMLVGLFLMRPGTVRTCGIVDYSPPTIVRAGCPGFVEEVKVREGETVQVGHVLAVMKNDELQVELSSIRVEIEKSQLQERMLRQNGEIAKAQAEAAKGRSLEQKEAEIRHLVEGLVVRAPLAGQVVAHDFDSLQGRYLAVGDEIVVIGKEERKEIILAAAQIDIRSFTAQKTLPVRVRIEGDESNAFTASLSKIDPRASVQLPHPALGADVGGALPVKPKQQSPDSNSVESELLDPCFSGTVWLSASQSTQLHAGQRATILFESSEQSWAGRLVMKVRQWIDDRLASP